MVTLISPVTKLLTLSLKVKVYVIVLAFVGLPTLEVIVHVGATVSTVIVQVAVFPLVVLAVIVQLPLVFPVTTVLPPLDVLIVAMAALLVVQVIASLDVLGVKVAVKVVVALAFSNAVVLFSDIPVALVFTVTLHVAVGLPLAPVAVIVQLPFPTPVISPVLLTVATPVLLLT